MASADQRHNIIAMNAVIAIAPQLLGGNCRPCGN
jgi:hypothetical protein